MDGAGWTPKRVTARILTIPTAFVSARDRILNGPMTLGFQSQSPGDQPPHIHDAWRGRPPIRAITTNGPVTLRKSGK